MAVGTLLPKKIMSTSYQRRDNVGKDEKGGEIAFGNKVLIIFFGNKVPTAE